MRFTFFLTLLFLCFTAKSQDTLTVMTYNVLNYPSSNATKADTLKPIIKYIEPDILMINELESNAGALTILSEALNVDGTTSYKKAHFFNGPDTDNMLYYNSNKLVLYSQQEIPTAIRNISEYVLYYKQPNIINVTDTVFIFCYSAHLKASSGEPNITKRNQEAIILKSHLDGRAKLENVFLGGDFNLYKSSEPAYQTILNGGNVSLFDPISSPGNWHNSHSFSAIHTQSTRSSNIGDGGSWGGLDDRFDFIFFNEQLKTGSAGLTYIPNTYKTIGNDGNHFNKSVNFGTNNSAPANVIEALHIMSDHLPVVLKASIPINTSIKENINTNKWKGYFKRNHFIFKSSKTEQELTINVYNALGHLIQTDKANNTKALNLKLPNLKRGVYLVQVLSQTQQKTFKLFKQ